MPKVIFLNIFSKSILCFTYFCFTCFNFHLFIKCLNVVGRKHPLFAVCVTLNSLSCNFIFLFLKSMGVHILVNLRRVPILCCNCYFMLTTQQASLLYHMTTSSLFIDLSFLKHNGWWTVSSLLVKGWLGLISKSKPMMSLELCYALLLINVLSNLEAYRINCQSFLLNRRWFSGWDDIFQSISYPWKRNIETLRQWKFIQYQVSVG